MKTIKIKSRHETLSEAVTLSGMDLSYNPREAAAKIRDTERPMGGGRNWKSGTAFLTEDGEVYFLYLCDINLLNKFEPFSACLHDGAFYEVELTEDSITITDRTFRNRKDIPAGLIVWK